MTNSPIIIFNPEGLTNEQIKLIKQALDDAYRAGYETAKEFYQLKISDPTNAPSQYLYGTIPDITTTPYQINNCGCDPK